MKDISISKLKSYLALIFLGVLITGGLVEVLLSYSEFDEYLDNLNYVSADTENSGFNFFTDAEDISLGVTGSYQTIDLSSYLPAGSSGAIIEVHNTDPSVDYMSFIRHPDSTDDFYDDIYRDSHHYVYVGVNSSLMIKGKIEHVNIDYYLIGYTGSEVTFFEDAIDYSTATTGSYVETDASAVIPSGSTGAILLINSTGVHNFAIRHPDSTDDFYPNRARLHPYYALTGINDDRAFEQKIDSADVDVYVIGYTKDPITFNVNWGDVSLAPTWSWEGIDVTAETSADANNVIIFIKSVSSSVYRMGTVRADGSTDAREIDSDIDVFGCLWAGVELNSTQGFEGYIENLDVNFYVVAYTEEVEGENEAYPDHIESSSLVTNATHTLLNNGTYAEIDPSGWIVWDFGSGVGENVTRINWDLVYVTSGGMFRIEGSTDAIHWDIVAQPLGTYGFPPVNNYKWSRYDSETHTQYRYYRVTAIYAVSNDWYVDSFWLTLQPPAIIYDDDTYVYPTVLEYWNWGINSENYQNIPYTTLGQNDTNPTDILNGFNESTRLVNSDYDSDNYIIVKFADYYNITSAEVHAYQPTSSGHFYLYISTTGESDDWDLVGDWSNVQFSNWYGDTSMDATRIRYMKLNCTGVGANYLYIESFRMIGEVHTGEGEEPDEDDDFSFMLLPDYLGDLLGIGLEGGQFLSSLIVMSAFLLPIAVYDRKGIIALIVGVAVFGFLVLIGWLPQWLMLIMILLVAGIYAFNFSSWFGGKR